MWTWTVQPGVPQWMMLGPKGLAKGGRELVRRGLLVSSSWICRVGQKIESKTEDTAWFGIVAVGSSMAGASGSRDLIVAKKVLGVV